MKTKLSEGEKRIRVGSWRLTVLAAAIAVAGIAQGAAVPVALELPTVLSSHMVLQRDMAVPIWGTAAPGANVTVTFAGQRKTAQADAKGAWRVNLDPLPASEEPRTMTVAVAGASANQPPLAIEDVLVGEVWLGSGQSNMGFPVKAFLAKDPVLAANADVAYPHLRLMCRVNMPWECVTPAASPNFPALMFSFGVSLQKTLHVPVGLMVSAGAGSSSGNWLSETAYRGDAACQAEVAKAATAYTADVAAKAQQAYSNELAEWPKTLETAKAAGDKKLPPKPAPPLKPGEFPVVIGKLYETCIRPLQPYAIRGVLWDQGESGTEIQGVDQCMLMGALIRSWRRDWGQGDFPFLYVQKPSGGGCAWDPSDSVTRLAEKFMPLPQAVPADGEIRETYIHIMQYTNTAMVIASDLGSGIHPLCKSGYGARAARVALGTIYGKPREIYGPLYAAHTVSGAKVRVTYTHVGQGLASRPGNKLQGFAVAGADKRFYWANAVIEGDNVVVSSAQVRAPVAVRYAWSDTHPWANLFNKDGLPALPFRTDAW